MKYESQVHVILNPVSGGGASRRAWPAVRSVLEASGAPWLLEETAGGGHAEELAASAVRGGAATVLVVGGDGTINEVVNGLLGSRDGPAKPREFPPMLAEPSELPPTPAEPAKPRAVRTSLSEQTDPRARREAHNRQGPNLAIVPAGAGNDFVKQLGVPRGKPTEAARLALSGSPRAVDAGRANGRWFVNGVGLGIDAFVAVEVAGARRIGGTFTYVLAIARALRTYRTATAHIAIDDDEAFEQNITMLAVTNGPCHGGGFWICPQALIDDGLLDVGTLDAMGPARVVPLAVRVTRGAHVGHPAVSFSKGRRVVVTTDTPLPAHVDGEVLDTAVSRLEVDVLPGALSVLV